MSFYFFLFDTSAKKYYLVFVQWTLRLCWRTLQVLHDPKQTATSRCMQWHDENGSSANEQHAGKTTQGRGHREKREEDEHCYNSGSPHSTIWYVFWNLKQHCLKSKVVDWWRVNLVRLINSLEGRLGDQSPYFLANNLSPGVFSGVVVWLSALV